MKFVETAATGTMEAPPVQRAFAPPFGQVEVAELLARQSIILEALDATADAIYLVDRATMTIIYVNETACRLHNMTREELISGGPSGALKLPLAQITKKLDAIIASGKPEVPVEIARTLDNGQTGYFELRRKPVYVGGRWLIVSLLRDITAAKQAQLRIVHLNRVHAKRSGISALIVRASSRAELFDAACSIASKEGGFPRTMIAMRDANTTKATLVASFGMPADVLAGLKLRFPPTELQTQGPRVRQTMVERALQEGKPILRNDLINDPIAIQAKQHIEAGIRAMALLPLMVGAKAVGVLTLYSQQKDFFRGEELNLLLELTQDIAFAIDHIDQRDRLAFLACYDSLTGLANQTLFLDRVTQYLHMAKLTDQRLVVYLVDVERFKNINDSLGRDAGDALLQQIGQWITHTLGDSNLVARVGTNHFAIVRPTVRETDHLEALLEVQLENFARHPFLLNDAVFRVSLKAGAAIYPADGHNAETLYKNAEVALKSAKLRSEPYRFYTQAMSCGLSGKVSLESKLRQALDRGEFVLHYQPKVDLATGKVTSAEALLRWNDPADGMTAPGYFIPILEETGLIVDVGRWVLRQALTDYLGWRASNLQAVRVAVNVSQIQLRQRGFVSEISRLVQADSAAASGLEIEITESVLMDDLNSGVATLTSMRELGVTIAIDDFGTRFSSLSYLSKLPLDSLKIDQSFIRDMANTDRNLALVTTIVTLAHALKLKVVAEGVETEEQAGLLRALGCDEMQGFLIGKALPNEEFKARYLPQMT